MQSYVKFSLLALTAAITACSSGGSSNSNTKATSPTTTPVSDNSPQVGEIMLTGDSQYHAAVKKLVVKSDKLDFTPNETFNSVTLSADNSDTGMNILKLYPDAINTGHGSVKHFVDGTKHFYLRNNDTNGWKYQSFGRYVDTATGNMALISVGQSTRELPVQNRATYLGIAMGDAKLNGEYAAGSGEIVSNVKIDVDFANKTLKFATTDTKGLNDNNQIVDYSNFNLNGNATWQAAENKFSGTVSSAAGASGKLNGVFYGAKAEEIGGTFDIKESSQEYSGGFGAKQ